MVTPTSHVILPGLDLHYAGPLALLKIFSTFSCQKESYHLNAGLLTGIEPCYGKSGPRRVANGGHRGHCPPIFIFAPLLRFFPRPPLYFFLEVSIALTVKIVVILTVPSPILTSILFD